MKKNQTHTKEKKMLLKKEENDMRDGIFTLICDRAQK